MRRLQILVVLLALLATPLALLARSMACNSASCTMMCCLPHAHSHGKFIPCHCSTKSGKQLPDFGLISLIAPTMTEEFLALDAPAATRHFVPSHSQWPPQEFPSELFNPPRS